VNKLVTRREAMSWLLAASISRSSVAKLNGTSNLAGRPQFDAIRSRARDAIALGKATGVAVTVIEDSRIVWEEGFGWANRAAKLRATPNTPFSMASITKPFTTTTLMTLVAEGRLALEDSANKYLAQGKISGSNGNPTASTVRMLGAHVSGLPGMYESYEVAESTLIPSPEVLLQAYGRLAYPAGSYYEYSNVGYAALHAIALALTKTELGTLMQRKVLGPLGLRDSFFGSDADRVPSGATRYDPLGRPIPHYTTSTPASGELYASAHDLATFLLFNMRENSDNANVLSERFKSELHRPVFSGPSGISSTFGWFRGQTATGVPFLFKSGGDPGVANRIFFVPSKGLGCVVVTNQSNAGELAYAICDDVMKSYLPDWQRPDEYCGFPKTSLEHSSAFRGKWRGRLQNGGITQRVALDFTSDAAATLAIGKDQGQPITELRMEGSALTGITSGLISSADALRTHATTLQIKLLPYSKRLIGRLFAVAGDPNFKNVRLPYVLSLAKYDSGQPDEVST
jgi:CubicO group peptidase (beta-lactamase class C family)